MVRLKDIAAHAGVSVMTVSKCLRNAKDISPATKERIRRLAAEMGYVPNLSASQLRSQSTRLFGLVISAVTNPIFARLMMGIEEKAHELGYELLLAQSLNDPDREESCIRRLLARRVEGLFITPVYRLRPVAPVYDEIRRLGIPTVILGQRGLFCSDFANVEVDDLTASAHLARHLLELGHRRIAYFCGPPVSPVAQERYEGFRRALRERDVELDDRLIFNAGVTMEEGEKAARQFLSENPGATAIQAVNDMVAIGAANVLLKHGVRIPQDLSVAGFGNILVAEHFRVPLTTVRQPKLRMGLTAMDLMQSLIAGGPKESRRLEAPIELRDSTAAVSGRIPALVQA